MKTIQEMFEALRSYPDPDAFARAFPFPALSLRIPSDDAKAAPMAKTTTVRLNDTVDDEKGLAALLGDPMDRTHVAFLQKSERNPFGSIISVGRASTNDVVIPHPSVSKVHAVFGNVGNTWKITDRKAKNGLYLNRVPVEPGATMTVDDGALVGIGSVVEGTFHTPRGLFQFLQLAKARKAR